MDQRCVDCLEEYLLRKLRDGEGAAKGSLVRTGHFLLDGTSLCWEHAEARLTLNNPTLALAANRASNR